MAKAQTTVKTVLVSVNNAKVPTSLTKTVELVVVNDKLVPDNRVLNPGVNSKQ